MNRRVALFCGLAAVVAVAALWRWQPDGMEEYAQFVFSRPRPPADFALDDLSERWTEADLRERFAGLPILCGPYRVNVAGSRGCRVEAHRYNGMPTLYLSFFFQDGRLDEVVVNMPWWQHRAATRYLLQTFGTPTAAQDEAVAGIRLVGWSRPSGAGVFLNRDRPRNPLDWNAIHWRSAASCARAGCFTPLRR
ncbi:MAG: hypothetical protein JSR41_15325 [Proteobacteria bacterium]|nr:hypothetical protein [Pseudomonadota bacterium]